MKEYILLTSFLLTTSNLHCEPIARPYIEGGIGVFGSSATRVSNFKYFDAGGGNAGPITAADIVTSFRPNINYTGEIGLANIFNNWRIGLSGTTVRLRGHTNGSITFTHNGSNTVYEDLDKGYSTTQIYTLNGYYEYSLREFPVTAFIGAGYGVYDNNLVVNKRPAYALHAGSNYNINSNLYLGLKGSAYYMERTVVNDGSDNRLSAHAAYMLNLVIGLKY